MSIDVIMKGGTVVSHQGVERKDIAVRDGRIKRGQTLLLEAFGSGFTWGSALIKF